MSLPQNTTHFELWSFTTADSMNDEVTTEQLTDFSFKFKENADFVRDLLNEKKYEGPFKEIKTVRVYEQRQAVS